MGTRCECVIVNGVNKLAVGKGRGGAGDLVSSPDGLAQVSEAVKSKGGRILGFSGSQESSLFVVDGPAVEVLKEVHVLVDSGRAKAVTSSESLAYVTIKGRGLEVVKAVSIAKAALINVGVKVPWVQIGSSHFSLLLSWDNLQKALETIEKTLGR